MGNSPAKKPHNLKEIPHRTMKGDQPEWRPFDDDEKITLKTLKADKNLSAPSVESAVHLSLQLKRTIVQSSSFNEQTFPMLASLKVDNIKSQIKAPLDLVCVIDQSGSMEGSKMRLVQNTFNYLLSYLGDNDRLSIVIFNHDAWRLIPLMRTTEKNKTIILEKVQTIETTGGTNIDWGMRCAFQILNQRRYKNAVSSIFLLSDGRDERAQDKVRKSIRSMKVQEDITIHSFGFGNDHDPQLMNDIASFRDGNFYFINELDTVDEAFVDCLGGLLSAVGQNVQIKIRPEDTAQLSGVKIVKAFGDAAMWEKEGNAYVTKLATLISGLQKDFVLELTIPANSKELKDHEKTVQVANAEATFTALDGKEVVIKGDLKITLLNEEEELNEDEKDNVEVMKNFMRVKGALVMEEARKLADERKYEDAQKVLKNFKEELENSFLKDEEFIKNLIKDIEQAFKNADSRNYMYYGKHAMIENARAQMYQKSNLKSANNYRNARQTEMMTTVKNMKAKK